MHRIERPSALAVPPTQFHGSVALVLLGLGASLTGVFVTSQPTAELRDPSWSAIRPALQEDEKDLKKEFDRLYGEAKGDVAKLLELYDWCEAYGQQKYQKRVLNAVLKLDDENARAHELLGHEFYDGKWWDDAKKLAKHRIEKERADAEAKGFVEYKGRWVDPADIPFLERGFVKDDEGNWIDPEVKQKLDEGWVRQDLEWIAPDQAENIAKGLWKCGEKWLSLADADEYHSQTGREWRIPYDDLLVIRTTLPRATADEIAKDLLRASRDVERFFGRQAFAVELMLFRSQDQYNTFAGGLGGQGGTDAFGWSSVRGAFFADLNWLPREQSYEPMGAGLWDLDDENGASFGRHFSRFAYGISAVESLDSSPDARERIAKSGINNATINAFYQEKKLPPVLRFGFASYLDRYFLESTARAGTDAHWARKWSMQNLTNDGGLDPLARVLAMPGEPSLDDERAAAETSKLLNQSGLVVSFILDGGCEPVVTAHAAFKEAFKGGDKNSIDRATLDLLDSVRKNEPAYRRWAES
jgi:hypothetical protein